MALSSFCSLYYFLILNGLWSTLSGKEDLIQSLLLGVYLLSTGLGGFAHLKLKKNNYMSLQLFEFLIGATGPVIFLLFYFVTNYYLGFGGHSNFSPQEIPLPFLIPLTAILILPLGFVTGLQLPLYIALKRDSEEKILYLNYLGALCAGPCLNLLNNHSIPIPTQLTLGGVASIFSLVFLLSAHYSWRAVLLPLGLATGFAIYFPLSHSIEKSFLTLYYHGLKVSNFGDIIDNKKLAQGIGPISRHLSPYQTIDLVEENPPRGSGQKFNISMHLNHKPQLGFLSFKTYHQSFYYGANNLSAKRMEAPLILGAGDGILLNLIQKNNPHIPITMVELDKKIVHISSSNYYLKKMNGDIFNNKNKNVKLVYHDAFYFLLNSSKKYDSVFIDFPYPYSDQIKKLYSIEFYQSVYNVLQDDGFIILDYPIYDEETSNDFSILKTLEKSGFKTTITFGPYASFIYAEKNKRPIDFNYSLLPQNLHMSTYLNLVKVPISRSIKSRPYSVFGGTI